MAMVETPDRIMTTGGWGDNGGGSAIWLILFAFLFMFRGRDGFGEGRDGGHHGGGDYGGYDGGIFRRNDANFEYLKRDNWDIQKEQLKASYEDRIKDLECCCKTNGNIDSVRCEVKEQGEKTRCLMVELEQKEALQRLTEKNAALEARLGRDEILHGVNRLLDERLGRHEGHRGDCDCGFHVRGRVEPIRYVPECDKEEHS